MASRAWWEKSRLEFFSISLRAKHTQKNRRHSSGSAIVSCLQSFVASSRTFLASRAESQSTVHRKAVEEVTVESLSFGASPHGFLPIRVEGMTDKNLYVARHETSRKEKLGNRETKIDQNKEKFSWSGFFSRLAVSVWLAERRCCW